MKRLMVFMIGLAMVFTASASAQPPVPSAPKDAAPAKVQVAPADEIGKKDSKKTKMTKKTKKENVGEAGIKPVVR